MSKKKQNRLTVPKIDENNENEKDDFWITSTLNLADMSNNY